MNEGGGRPSAQRLTPPSLLAGEGWGDGDDFVRHASRPLIERGRGPDRGEYAHNLRAAVIEATGCHVLCISKIDRMINRGGVLEIIANAGVATAPTASLPQKPVRGQGSEAGNQDP